MKVSKGRIQAEELRGQLGERLVGAYQATARAMGMTTEELAKQTEQGKMTAEEVFPLLRQELMKMAKSEGQLEVAMNDTASAGWRFANAMTIANTRFNEAGFDRGVRNLLERLADFVKSSGGLWETFGQVSELALRTLAAPLELMDALGNKMNWLGEAAEEAGFKFGDFLIALIFITKLGRRFVMPVMLLATAISSVGKAVDEGGFKNWGIALGTAALAAYVFRRRIGALIDTFKTGHRFAKRFWDAARGKASSSKGPPDSIRKPDKTSSTSSTNRSTQPSAPSQKQGLGFLGGAGAFEAARNAWKEAEAWSAWKGMSRAGYSEGTFIGDLMEKQYPAMGREGALTRQEQEQARQMIVQGDVRFEITGDNSEEIADSVLRVINEQLIRPASTNDPVTEK